MNKRICVFGSSIAWGANDKYGGWVKYLWEQGLFGKEYFEVYNLAVSGAISTNVLNRCESEVVLRKSDIVIIAIGLNDSVFDKNRNCYLTEEKKFKNNISDIITILQNQDVRVAVVGLTCVDEKLVQPIPWAINLSYSNKDIKKYDNIIKEATENSNVPYCYVYDLLQKEDLYDGLHPNTQGHKKMFERIKKILGENNIV